MWNCGNFEEKMKCNVMKWIEMKLNNEMRRKKETNMAEIALEVWSALHAKFMISNRADGWLARDPPLYWLCCESVLGHIF